MAIDPNDTAALLSEARVALHKLNTGTAVVEVDCGDYRTRFSVPTIEKLKAYVADLEARLDGARTRGAIGFLF